MAKIVFIFALLIAAVVAGQDEPCVEKPCTREYKPVSVTGIHQKCQEFPNVCFLENAIRCQRLAPNIVCMKGTCGNHGEIFACPGALDY